MLCKFRRDDFNRFHIGLVWKRQYSKQGCTDFTLYHFHLFNDSNYYAVKVFGNNLQVEVLNMKTIILCIILLMAPGFLIAQEINGSFTMGYVPELEGFSTNLNVCLTIDRFSVYGGVEVLMEYNSFEFGPRFAPYRDTYSIGSKYYITEWLFVEFDHSCTHPVYSSYQQFYDKFTGGNRTDLILGIQW